MCWNRWEGGWCYETVTFLKVFGHSGGVYQENQLLWILQDMVRLSGEPGCGLVECVVLGALLRNFLVVSFPACDLGPWEGWCTNSQLFPSSIPGEVSAMLWNCFRSCVLIKKKSDSFPCTREDFNCELQHRGTKRRKDKCGWILFPVQCPNEWVESLMEERSWSLMKGLFIGINYFLLVTASIVRWQ